MIFRRVAGTLVLIVLGASPLWAVPASTNAPAIASQTVVKLKGKAPMTADSAVYEERSARYFVVQGTASMRFSTKEVEYVKPPKPKGFNAATNDIAQLEIIVRDYRRLWWDTEAFKHLMPLYVSAGQHTNAVALYEDIRKRLPAPPPLSLQRNYWDALLASRQFEKLDKELDEAIKNGSHEETALAYILFHSLWDANVLVACCAFLHYEALRFVNDVLPRVKIIAPRIRVAAALLMAMVSHIGQIALFAFAFYILRDRFSLGLFGGQFEDTFSSFLYFSAETYTSLGFGDIYPVGALRMVTGIEALTGLLMISWTASFTYLEMRRFW